MHDLTLKAIGEQLSIPEATLRFYRDRYADFIPCSGEGRTRRYPEAAMEVLKTIADLTKAGKKAEEITANLYDMYPVNPTAMTAMQTQDEPQRPQRAAVTAEETPVTAMTAMGTQRLPQLLPQSPQAMMTALIEGQNMVLGELVNLLAKRNALAADSLPDILTIKEAAGLARVSVSTLRKKMKDDPTFPVRVFGSRKRVPKGQFVQWMGGGMI